MTDVGRMSVGELVGKVLADEHADVLRDAVCWLAQELMEVEVTAAAGAGYGERSPERTARRNGYRERAWDTLVGSIELAIPKAALDGGVGPLGLGGPVLEVDTSSPVDVTAVASWVKRQPEWHTPLPSPPTHNPARR
jgi:hypothetical protein